MPERYVPYIDSDGEKWRNQQLIDQLPPQDNEVRLQWTISMHVMSKLAHACVYVRWFISESLRYDERKQPYISPSTKY